MYMIAFHYKHHSGLLELMFDSSEEAEEVLDQFNDASVQPVKATLRIVSKYGRVVLNVQDYSVAVLSDLDETRELMISLAVRRAMVEQRAKTEFARWAKTHMDLLTGGMDPGIKVPPN